MSLSRIYFQTIALIHPSHALRGIQVHIKITEEHKVPNQRKMRKSPRKLQNYFLNDCFFFKAEQENIQ